MKILNFIDSKTTFAQQKRFLKSYFFGLFIGFLVTELSKYLLFNKSDYTFRIDILLLTITFGLILISPIIYNYFKYIKKYKKFIKKIKTNPKLKLVKFKFNFDKFNKNDLGYIFADLCDSSLITKKNGTDGIFIKDTINKFELVDLQENRKNKLKKLK